VLDENFQLEIRVVGSGEIKIVLFEKNICEEIPLLPVLIIRPNELRDIEDSVIINGAR